MHTVESDTEYSCVQRRNKLNLQIINLKQNINSLHQNSCSNAKHKFVAYLPLYLFILLKLTHVDNDLLFATRDSTEGIKTSNNR